MEGGSELACVLATYFCGLRCRLGFTVGHLNPTGHRTLNRPHMLHPAGLHASHACQNCRSRSRSRGRERPRERSRSERERERSPRCDDRRERRRDYDSPRDRRGPPRGYGRWVCVGGGRREGLALLVRTLLASLVQPCPGTFLSQQGETFTPVFLGG
jgi:hypothetical protein